MAEPTSYPSWVLGIAAAIIFAGIAPIPIVFLLRRFQCVKLDVDIHQGSIRRIDTTVSTKEMMGDVDVSRACYYNHSNHVFLSRNLMSYDPLKIVWRGKNIWRKIFPAKIALWLVMECKIHDKQPTITGREFKISARCSFSLRNNCFGRK